MEPIDISSDSDVEITDVGGSLALSPKRTSTNSRVLPSWASTAATSSRNAGYMYNNSSKKLQPQPGSGYSIGGLDQPTSTSDGLYLTSNGYFGEPRGVNTWIANVSGNDYEKLSSQQAFKRALPTSIQPSPHHGGSYFSEGASSSQSNNVYGSMFHSGGPELSNNYRAYLGEHDNRSNDDDPIIVHERNGSRILPPSLMPRKSVLSGSSAITIDSVPRSLGGDERAVGNDERIIFQAALQDLYQPKLEADVPDGLLSVSLLKHQKIALAWMLQRETRSLHCLGGILADDQGLGKTISMIALIQTQKSLDSSSKLEDNDKKTEALNLDEDEDKKLEALNLDEDDDNGGTAPDKPNQAGESGDTKQDKQVTTSKKKFSGRRPSAGTLVVCPASVLRQWAGELDDKVAAEAKLSVLVYHGGSRTKDPVELAKYDVVLTTYAIVNNEVPKQPLVDEDDLEGNIGENGLTSEFSFSKKQKKVKNVSKKRKKGKKGIDAYTVDSGTLARVGWSRVILDEAQTIKNHRTQVARACCSLRAKRRWCLSGTPIQNTIDDLYSYFRFLRYEPYNVYKSFYNTIKVPISKNSINGYKKLQVVLKGILLRRTKGTLINGEPIINLPPKSVSLNRVHFSDKERAFYTWLEAESRSKFKAYAAAGTVKLNYANILLMLLRLRQACDHPVLVNGISSASVGKISAEMAKKIPKDRVVELLNHLAASSAICCVCSDPPEDPVVTMCGHVFCYQCVSEQFTGDDNECPAPNCKEQLGPHVVFSEATLRSCAASDDLDANITPSELDEPSMVWQRDFSSSKVQALLNILMSDCAENGPNSKLNDHGESNSACRAFSNYPTDGPRKSIIFSQWTGMLDLVEDALKLYYIEFRRLDGTMSLAARDKAVKDFNTDPEISVMLMSLKAGNLGLNMVAACHVILLDLWWNPTTEDQAVDRAHRIGQMRPVTVTRLTVKDTVEDRILALQEEKRKMVASAFGEDQSGGSATRLTLQDLRYLFNVNND